MAAPAMKPLFENGFRYAPPAEPLGGPTLAEEPKMSASQQKAYDAFRENEARRQAWRAQNGVTDEMLQKANSVGSKIPPAEVSTGAATKPDVATKPTGVRGYWDKLKGAFGGDAKVAPPASAAAVAANKASKMLASGKTFAKVATPLAFAVDTVGAAADPRTMQMINDPNSTAADLGRLALRTYLPTAAGAVGGVAGGALGSAVMPFAGTAAGGAVGMGLGHKVGSDLAKNIDDPLAKYGPDPRIAAAEAQKQAGVENQKTPQPRQNTQAGDFGVPTPPPLPTGDLSAAELQAQKDNLAAGGEGGYFTNSRTGASHGFRGAPERYTRAMVPVEVTGETPESGTPTRSPLDGMHRVGKPGLGDAFAAVANAAGAQREQARQDRNAIARGELGLRARGQDLEHSDRMAGHEVQRQHNEATKIGQRAQIEREQSKANRENARTLIDRMYPEVKGDDKATAAAIAKRNEVEKRISDHLNKTGRNWNNVSERELTQLSQWQNMKDIADQHNSVADGLLGTAKISENLADYAVVDMNAMTRDMEPAVMLKNGAIVPKHAIMGGGRFGLFGAQDVGAKARFEEEAKREAQTKQ